MRLPQRSSKAFTLIELIVVIVILGILALIAIPTFGKVTKRSQDASTSATISAVLRDARALMAFNDGTSWDDATTMAVTETSMAGAPGLFAASMTARKAVSATISDAEPARAAEAVYALVDSGVVVSMRSASGNVCIASASLGSSTTPTCLPGLASGKSSALATATGGVLSSGAVLPLASGAFKVGAGSGSLATPAPAITAVAVDAISGTVTVTGTSLGSLSPYSAADSRLWLTDTTKSWQVGHVGNTIGVTVSSWTPTQVVFKPTSYSGSSVQMMAGDSVAVNLVVPGLTLELSSSVVVPEPDFSLTNLTVSASTGTVTVTGVNLGSVAAYSGLSTRLWLIDDMKWQVGTTGNGVGVTMTSWTPTQVVFKPTNYPTSVKITAGETMYVFVQPTGAGQGKIISAVATS